MITQHKFFYKWMLSGFLIAGCLLAGSGYLQAAQQSAPSKNTPSAKSGSTKTPSKSKTPSQTKAPSQTKSSTKTKAPIPASAKVPDATPSISPKEQQDLDFADGLYQRGLYDAAARQYGEFIKNHPKSAQLETVYFRRGESLYQQSNALAQEDIVKSKVSLIEARGAFQDYINKFPTGSKLHESLLRIGEISYKANDPDNAAVSLDRVIQETKDNSLLEAALFYSARSLEKQDKIDESEKRYHQLRDTFRKGQYAAYATYLLAEMMEKNNKNQEAADLLNDLWQNAAAYTIPADSTLVQDAQLRAAQMLYKMNKFEEASKAYQAYSQANPGGENMAKALYGAAWAEYQAQDYAEALQIAESLQQESLPAELAAGILFLKGTCSYQQKQYPEAIVYFRQVIADPNSGEYRERSWYQLAWSYYLTKQYDEAIQESQNLLQQNLPLDMSANVHFLLAQTVAQQNKFPEAIGELRLVLDLKPDGEFASEALYLLADLLYRTEQYAESANAFLSYYQKFPKGEHAQEALQWACNAQFSAKDFANAIQTAQKLLDTYPDIEGKNDVLYRKALAHYQLKEYDPALKTFEQLMALAGPERKAEALYWQAYIYELNENTAKAAELYAQLLNEYPNYENKNEVLLRKALCDYRNENTDDAYRSFVNILETDKAKDLPAEVIFWVIFQASEKKQHEQALAISEKILALHQEPSIQERALIAKGNELVALNRWKEAKENAETFLKTFEQSLFKPEIYWTLAKAEEGLNDTDQAIAHYEKSLEELTQIGNPDPGFEASLYVDRGRLMQKNGKTAQALESFLRVAIIFDHPELTPEAMYRSVQCHKALNEIVEAESMYQELTARYPDSEWTAKAKREFEDLDKEKPAETQG